MPERFTGSSREVRYRLLILAALWREAGVLYAFEGNLSLDIGNLYEMLCFPK